MSVNSCADKNIVFQFCISVRTCETSCFTDCIRWGIVSRDSIVDGDWLPATDLLCRTIVRWWYWVTVFAKNLGVRSFLVRSVHPRGKSLSWF